ncbi:MAG: putative two-component system sensor histidine kinase, putative heat shock protein [Phycisphaerales bacterium]|nr:putative two-component system sensor histidine kinase, putative heat shock protein [Phycisphaerales bacterium]
MANIGFTVDTHLFRELGELLVGRDSTALVELIKNSYDADATEVIVHGVHLDDVDRGCITIRDTGIGMTSQQFRDGFLRIASRLKEEGERRSPKFRRRFTGAKGIGRLAAHKLARKLKIYSVPDPDIAGEDSGVVSASIDWDAVEAFATLDQVDDSGAVQFGEAKRPGKIVPGTTIELRGLRRQWTPTERGRFFAEVQTFSPPSALLELPKAVIASPLLFSRPAIADSTKSDPGCNIQLTGDLESGESYWAALAQAALWVIEVEANQEHSVVRYAVSPTKRGREAFPEGRVQRFEMVHPDPKHGPFFQARILIREGATAGRREEKAWLGRTSGIRVYMEGFRVLPYGEPSDDWLSIDTDYTRRQKMLPYLSGSGLGEAEDEEEGLLALRNTSYFGAVFLTLAGAPTMQMLVNREGFIPERGFDSLVRIVRTGVDLSVRVRAAAKSATRHDRTEVRKQRIVDEALATDKLDLQDAVRATIVQASDLAREARQKAASGDFAGAAESITRAAEAFAEGGRTSERMMTEPTLLRILASVGTQMSAFVHEINGLLGSAQAVEQAIFRMSADLDLPRAARARIRELQQAIGDLRRSVERQAAYLTDVISPDARRRRSRQRLAERFNAGARIVEHEASRRDISIINEIPDDLKSPPMFPAELTLIFSNLLTNAVKAAGKGGRIRATARAEEDGVTLRVENTGVIVDFEDGERWFRPFESTTVQTDPVLGQGMGMGLPITRNILEQYGATIAFARPGRSYSTAIEILFRG